MYKIFYSFDGEKYPSSASLLETEAEAKRKVERLNADDDKMFLYSYEEWVEQSQYRFMILDYETGDVYAGDVSADAFYDYVDYDLVGDMMVMADKDGISARDVGGVTAIVALVK